MKEIFTAKTIEEAKQMASAKFGVSVDYIVFRILEEPKKSLFGKVKREAQVEASYEPVEEVAPAPAAVPEETSAAPAPAKAETAPAAAKPGEMGIETEITVMQTANGVRMEISSQNKSGTIIGRRGETLDSIQYLASILVNKDSETYCRLLLDSNGYREKRRKTLEQLAEKIARSVLRTGRSTTLEPMNPYERRIIHSRIAEIDGVTSRSVGEDPYRKVVVSSVNGRRQGGNRGGRNGQNHGGKRPYRERGPEDFKRKNLDSMKTSFERDYKKPKPEDELNAGLYGKIEF